MTAYHESGHALLAWLVPGIDHLHKVSIIPRGRSLGATQLLPEEDRFNISEGESAHAAAVPAGRPGRRKTGLRRVQRRRRGRPEQGHPDRPPHGHPLGHERAARAGGLPRQRGASLPGQGEIAAPRQFSEHTAQVIDEEVIRILRAASDRAQEMLGAESRQARPAGQHAGEGRDAGRANGDRIVGAGEGTGGWGLGAGKSPATASRGNKPRSPSTGTAKGPITKFGKETIFPRHEPTAADSQRSHA